ncbi:MAG: tetratricopeptide repeat protein [Desertifilum sp.]|nr:tetratricopeptide repeat protein [Oscillatoria laete-virens]MCD8490132.1 tetratricopeptide repeat protein [Desertifilum sp.]
MPTKAAQIIGLLWISLIVTIPQAAMAQTDLCPPTEPGTWRLFDPDREAERVRRAQSLLAKDPESVEAYLELGSALLSLCRYEEAIGAYRQVAQLTPKRAIASFAYNQIGLSFDLQGQYEEANAAYQQAMQLADSP